MDSLSSMHNQCKAAKNHVLTVFPRRAEALGYPYEGHLRGLGKFFL